MVVIVAALLGIFVLLPGKSGDQVTLLPGPDGRPSGVVTIERGGSRQVLDQSYATSRSSDSQVVRRSEQEVRAEYSQVLAALPARPASFLLYFVSGTDELTEESKLELNKVLEELKKRPVADVAVIAHTDTVGDHDSNDRLSAQRAETMKGFLVRTGVPPERVQASGRGEREPLVPTADNVDEPRNRRVEISVR